jgi:hypothetical protein
MRDEPGDQRSEDPAPEPQPTGRSHYEDLNFEVPLATPAPGRRTPTVTVAAVVLGFSGLLPLISVIAFSPSGGVAIALLVLGVAELLGAALVLLLHPLGRALGFVLGSVGLVIGLITARSSPANGLVTMGLNGYVIYAMAISGASFRRG